MVTVMLSLITLTYPRGPLVRRTKESVGCKEGGLRTPDRVKEILEAANCDPKQLLSVTVLPLLPTEQALLSKEELSNTTVSSVMTEGNSTMILPPAGMGSGRVAVKA